MYLDDDEKIAKQAREENDYHLRRRKEFRLTAEHIASALSAIPEIQKIVLFGSVAKPLKKERTRFWKYCKIGAELYHYCNDIDLVVWIAMPTQLRQIQRIIGKTVAQLTKDGKSRVAHHQVDVFFVEPGTNRYIGRLCEFAKCSKKEKLNCVLTPNCGKIQLLRQHQGFVMNPDDYTNDTAIILFER
jgi:hypothetical protein